MDNQAFEEKLILLYLIREKDNITPDELSDFIIFRGYMDYFSMGNYLQELLDNRLVLRLTQGDKSYYTLHPRGIEVVEMFRARIDHSIREEIRSYAQNAFLHSSPMLEADVAMEETEKGYQLNCRVHDYDNTDSLVLELRLTADTEEEAKEIRDNWNKKGMSVYWNLLRDIGGRNARDNEKETETGGSDADTGAQRNV